MTFVGFLRQALCEDSFYEATILDCGHLASSNDHLGSSQSGGSGWMWIDEGVTQNLMCAG